jgi:hypothetical protein
MTAVNPCPTCGAVLRVDAPTPYVHRSEDGTIEMHWPDGLETTEIHRTALDQLIREINELQSKIRATSTAELVDLAARLEGFGRTVRLTARYIDDKVYRAHMAGRADGLRAAADYARQYLDIVIGPLDAAHAMHNRAKSIERAAEVIRRGVRLGTPEWSFVTAEALAAEGLLVTDEHPRWTECPDCLGANEITP